MSTVERTPPPAAPEPAADDEAPVLDRARRVLRDVLRLVDERAEAEAAVEAARKAADENADRDYRRTRQALDEKVEGLSLAARKADDDARRAAVDEAINGEAEAKSIFGRASRRIASEFDGVREKSKADYQRDKADVQAGFDAAERESALKFAEERKPVDDADNVIASMRQRVDTLYDDYGKLGLGDPPTSPSRETYKSDDPHDQLFDRLAKLEKPLALLEGLVIPKLMKGARWVWLVVVFFPLFAVPFVAWQGATGAGAALGAALVAGFLARTWLASVAKAQVSERIRPITQSIVDAHGLSAHCRAAAEQRYRDRKAAAAGRRDQEAQKARQRREFLVSTGENVRDEQLREINEVYARRSADLKAKQKADLRAASEAYERRKSDLGAQFQANLSKLDLRYHEVKTAARTKSEADWQAMADRWREGVARNASDLDDLRREADGFGPAWDDPSWADRPATAAAPPALRFGDARLDLAERPGGVPDDPRLRDGLRTDWTFPALRPFPARANLLVETDASGRPAALGVLQASMLRVLTSLPPGQVRFTIIDPLGIGRTFGAFMHLADYDEALVNGQVWTEPRQIEERLAELSAHMEKVAQKYLRNEYATIDEYNAVAGEVAEPYRVVVVADFPAGFDEKSAARLAAIASGGVPCGVLTMVALDRDRPTPPGFSPADLAANALTLTWDGDKLAWGDPDFGALPTALDGPPPPELATRLIQRAGAWARDAKRVEVPFEFIAPAEEDWWTLDSRAGVDVPLGKAGATKRQNLALGRGTSQHALVAGRTGSGKSTLLHALIVNVALNYSPDEVELYLIDFKKGVEFKVYATHRLPHAAVVAIESEREFGISVLQRLDAEMRDRAERFREAGVQDLNGFRNAPGTPPLPRVLLVVDEFQEFFVEEDKLAQEAALLLDRLVRQGRAFGVHVLLGSQTLGGAFSLARTTLGQMAVRIALQCSEADAHLILSESNTAAKLLSRPGEAVYNDANGLAEGNHFFQVVWLGDDRREAYLEKIAGLARDRKPKLARTPIVFEGDAPADLTLNAKFRPLLDAPAWTGSPRSATAWLGDAVAIKDPTAAVFRRQGGNHLLVVGQKDEAALGVLTSTLLSLAAQFPPATSDTSRSGVRFALLDGSPEDHPRAGYLGRVAGRLPHPVESGGWRDTGRILGGVAAEVARRQEPGAPDGPEIFLFVHDLPRFRDLRRKEDDFGFGRKEDEATPADHLRAVLREGPGVGVHIVTWCDNLNNLNRVFDHQGLREFEMRVLFQMSPNDSGHLLDAPHASKLGANRALFASEEENLLEKFRPYGLPPDEWLDDFARRLRERPTPAAGGSTGPAA